MRKDALDFDLAAAVREVAAGNRLVDPTIARQPRPGDDQRIPTLSPRQREILQLICDGLPYDAIATKLDLSVNTVAVHRANIMKTLRVHRSAALIAYAIRHDLVRLP